MRALLLVIPVVFFAACTQPAGITIADGVYRAPLTTNGVGVAYFSITSSEADRITSVSSPVAGRVEMHASIVKDGMASMERLDSVELPAGQTVEFEPGGMHVMVFEPQPIVPDATFPIQITLQSGVSKTVSLRQGLGGETEK